MEQIIFAGGIHGVGKSTLCNELSAALPAEYLSASELLKWQDLNNDRQNKKVSDIPDTQNRLINGLKKVVKANKIYILDGHFCLFNQYNEVTPIPMETFKKIKPILIVLIIAPILSIKTALEIRDGRVYDIELLSVMQDRELNYACEIARNLDIPLIIYDKNTNDIPNLISQIHESLT